MSELRDAILTEAKRLGIDPNDLATAISYETAGTFNPWTKGPVTQHGQHRGLIQWGEPQRETYGVYKDMPVAAQMRAVTSYLRDRGVKPGHGLLDIYSAINAGRVGLYDRTDENNGGAPGTVRDKVMYQMAGHKAKGRKLLGGLITAPTVARPGPSEALQATTAAREAAEGEARSSFLEQITDDNPYADYRAPIVENRFEKAANAQDDPYTLGQAIVGAASTDWMASNMLSRMGEGYDEDPNWAPTPEEWSKISKEIPEVYHEDLLDATSAQDFADRQAWAMQDAAVVNKLTDMGVQGTVIRMGVMAVDPFALAAMVATDGVAAPAIAAAKFGRLGRILLRGTALGMENAGFEAAAMRWDPKISELDIIAAGGLGMFLGSTLGAIARPATANEARAMRNVAQNLMDHPEDVFSMRGAGAAENLGERPVIGNVPIIDPADVPDVALPKWRFDMSATMNKSKDPLTKLWGRALLDEGVGMADHGVSETSASVRAGRRHHVAERSWGAAVLPAMRGWAKNTGKSKWLGVGDYSDADWNEFGGLVGDFVRDRRPNAHLEYDKNVVTAGLEFRNQMRQYAEEMQNPAIRRGGIADPISEVGPDDFYFPRYADPEAASSISSRYTNKQIVDFIKEAIRKAQPDIDEDLLHRMASGYWDNLRVGGIGAQSKMDDAFHRGSFEDFKAAVLESQGAKDIDDALLEKVFFEVEDLVEKPGATKGRSDSPRTKRKTLMDEEFEAYLVDKSGKMGERPLRMSDFFVRDADFVLRKYSRHMSGRVALADTAIRDPNTGEVLVRGVYSNGEVEQVIQQVERSWASLPLSGEEIKRGAHQSRRHLEYAFQGILGQPLYDTGSGLARLYRRIMALNFFQLMGNLGINQAQETARWIGHLGFRAATRHMTGLKQIIDGETGHLVSPRRLDRELQAITGKGMDVDFRRWQGRFDDDLLATSEYGAKGKRIDRALIKMGQFTSKMSMMNYIHAWQQNGAMKGISQRMYDLSRQTLVKGAEGRSVKDFDLSKLKGKDLEKLRSLGWSDADVRQIFRHMSTHAEVDGGTHLRGMNFEKWDPDAKEKFANTLYRYTNRLIQENDMGDLNHWMTQPAVKMMFQFRSFVMAAYVKNTLHGIHHFDAKQFVSLMGEYVAGVATYAALTHVRALGRSDKEEYLKKNASTDQLALQGFARMAAASITPMVIDSAVGLTTGDQLFSKARASGSAMDPVVGSSIFQGTIQSLNKGLRGGAEALVMGRSPTQGEMRALWRGVMTNSVILSPILNAMISDLPEKKQ